MAPAPAPLLPLAQAPAQASSFTQPGQSPPVTTSLSGMSVAAGGQGQLARQEQSAFGFDRTEPRIDLEPKAGKAAAVPASQSQTPEHLPASRQDRGATVFML